MIYLRVGEVFEENLSCCSSDATHLVCEIRSLLDLSSDIWLGRLTSEPKESFCLHLLSDGIIGASHHVWLFMCVLGIEFRPSCWQSAMVTFSCQPDMNLESPGKKEPQLKTCPDQFGLEPCL